MALKNFLFKLVWKMLPPKFYFYTYKTESLSAEQVIFFIDKKTHYKLHVCSDSINSLLIYYIKKDFLIPDFL